MGGDAAKQLAKRRDCSRIHDEMNLENIEHTNPQGSVEMRQSKVTAAEAWLGEKRMER